MPDKVTDFINSNPSGVIERILQKAIINKTKYFIYDADAQNAMTPFAKLLVELGFMDCQKISPEVYCLLGVSSEAVDIEATEDLQTASEQALIRFADAIKKLHEDISVEIRSRKDL